MTPAGADPHAAAEVRTLGPAPGDASVALVLLHGRGAGADDIVGLVDPLRERGAPEATVLAPDAVGRTWYPYPFLMPTERNEPYLTSALATVARCVERLRDAGVRQDRIVVVGFSQGACLASEFVARQGGRWGGVAALSGGLIGERVDPGRYAASLDGTVAFFGCSDVDAHIPEERVLSSARQLAAQGAQVTTRIYPGMPHTINDDELRWLATHLAAVAEGRDAAPGGVARA